MDARFRREQGIARTLLAELAVGDKAAFFQHSLRGGGPGGCLRLHRPQLRSPKRPGYGGVYGLSRRVYMYQITGG